MLRTILLLILSILFSFNQTTACSILYFVDQESGKIYLVNNEDYWYDEDAYLQFMPASQASYARLWYGWDKFAQGGVNEHGLCFDGAVTPEQEIPEGYKGPNGRNIGDELLATCQTVEESIAFLEEKKIALTNAHLFLGDGDGNAVILEWIEGEKQIIQKEGNYLIATNYLLAKPEAGNYPCYRYNSIQERVKQLELQAEPVTLQQVGMAAAGAVQAPKEVGNGKTGGTLYTSFINLTDGEIVIVPKLNNEKVIKLDLQSLFKEKKKRKIKLD
ncbi:MAG: carcinine hydrolase/isopenicillin-N N-acyltransferase family protein [Bacteroidota bacterium]